jgi:hypothetical protein
MSEGMHFRFSETPPDIHLSRIAERRLAVLRAGLGHPAPCVVRVRESMDTGKVFHVRVDCELGRARGVATAEASAGSGADALERAFERLSRRLLGAGGTGLAPCSGGE